MKKDAETMDGSNKAGGSMSRDLMTTDIHAVRSRLVDKCLVYFAIVIPFALILSLTRIFEHGWHSAYLLHIGIAGLLIPGAVLRKRLSYRVRAYLLLGIWLTMGAIGVFAFGLVGGGIIMLALFIVMVTIAFGKQAGLIASVISFIIIAAMGVAVCTETIAFSFDIAEYATSITAWLVMVIIFILVVPMIIVALGVVHEQLASALRDLQGSHAKHERLVNNLFDTFLYRHDAEGTVN